MKRSGLGPRGAGPARPERTARARRAPAGVLAEILAGMLAGMPAVALTAVAGAGLVSCGAPRWQVTEKDPGGALLVDGRVVSPTTAADDDATDDRRLDRLIPYYGRADVAVVPAPAPPSDNPSAPPLPDSSVRAGVPIPPPVSRWLFPIDFVLEMALLPFGPDDDVVSRAWLGPGRRVDAVPAGPDAVGDESGLRDRARTAVRAR